MQSNAFEEKLYTSTEVAEILGVSLRSIYRYLDENKLQAAVKTATGRHRFTRQNINDFLHPSTEKITNQEVSPSPTKESLSGASGVQDSIDMSGANINVEKTFKQDKELSQTVEEETASEKLNETKVKDSELEKDQSQEVKEVKDESEPIDWLARFRQAAEKYKKQDINHTTEDSAESESQAETLTKIDKVTKSVEKVEKDEDEETEFNYYRSGVGGLKEIAQSLDKSAKNASLDYAFTMNAGLSLHKPIKPFSLIHAYVRPSDLAYFEKVLQLTPSLKDTAQLCLIASDKGKLYSQGKELHGLYVVSDDQIKADLIAEGELELANELD